MSLWVFFIINWVKFDMTALPNSVLQVSLGIRGHICGKCTVHVWCCKGISPLLVVASVRLWNKQTLKSFSVVLNCSTFEKQRGSVYTKVSEQTIRSRKHADFSLTGNLSAWGEPTQIKKEHSNPHAKASVRFVQCCCLWTTYQKVLYNVHLVL